LPSVARSRVPDREYEGEVEFGGGEDLARPFSEPPGPWEISSVLDSSTYDTSHHSPVLGKRLWEEAFFSSAGTVGSLRDGGTIVGFELETGERDAVLADTLDALADVSIVGGRLEEAMATFEEGLGLCAEVDLPIEAAVFEARRAEVTLLRSPGDSDSLR
jgi:hypothetical protein